MVPDYAAVLTDLAATLQQLAVVQLAGIDSLDPDTEFGEFEEFASSFSPELIQLFYEIAVAGRRDLYLAPDPRLGFEMCLLRMLAFAPGDAAVVPAAPTAGGVQAAKKPVNKPEAQSAAKPAAVPAQAAAQSAQQSPATGKQVSAADWPALINSLQLSGMAGQLAQNSALVKREPGHITLSVDDSNGHLLSDNLKNRLTKALSDYLGEELRVTIDVVVKKEAGDTVARREASQQQQALDDARLDINTDKNVRDMMELMDASVDEASIKPLN